MDQENVGRVTDALKATRDKDTWTVMIAGAKERGTILIDSMDTAKAKEMQACLMCAILWIHCVLH